MDYSFPAMEEKFKNGRKIIFLGFEQFVPKGTDIVEWNGQKMTVEAFIRLDLKQQIVVTKEKNGELLAREKEVFARAYFDAIFLLIDSYGVPRVGPDGKPPAGSDEAWKRFEAISDEDRMKMVWEIMKNQREEAIKAPAATTSN